jgi:glycosyltransferase involved in cell wall biosynthesis
MIKIAVLIPTKNRRTLLERALTSLFIQTVKPDEIIVVNDGSDDDTKDFLDKFQNNQSLLKVINREKSGGVNVARHEGINLADSEWIACLDDDDEFLSDAVEKIKNRLEKIPTSCDIAFFNTIIKNNKCSFNGGFQFKANQKFYDLSYDDMMFIRSKIKGDCKPVLRKKLFTINGYKFPESVNGSESHLFYLIARDGKGIRCYPEITTLIHQETEVGDRLSLSASAKNPWPLFVLHFKQLFQHWKFYLRHPIILYKKKVTMAKLLLRAILQIFL